VEFILQALEDPLYHEEKEEEGKKNYRDISSVSLFPVPGPSVFCQ
jgi:hypothetical protein